MLGILDPDGIFMELPLSFWAAANSEFGSAGKKEKFYIRGRVGFYAFDFCPAEPWHAGWLDKEETVGKTNEIILRQLPQLPHYVWMQLF